MAVAQRHDGVGQYGFSQQYSRMAPPSSYPNFGYDRRSQADEHAEPMWPVPRMQQQLQQGSAADRSRHLAGYSNSFSQPDLARHQEHPSNYTYDNSSSAALRNPVVYSQPAQVPWGMAGQSSTDYAEYPTASFMAPMAQRPQPSLHSQAPYLGGNSGAYGDSSLHAGNDAFPKMMNGSAPALGAPYDHTAETLWPLGPNSLDAFAGIPAPSGQVTRITLTSAADRGKLKARSSVPPPKQFKCSACDAIFSRNHDLKRHARIHLAVKPFPCGYCDKAFSRKDALKRHVLVKGCGIGNKKQNDSRKRAATLSKLEHSEGGSTARAPYDGGSSDARVRDFSGFRDDLHYQGQQQQHQGLQGDACNSRGLPDRINASWPTAFPDPNNASSNVKTEYGSSHGTQLPQGGSLQSYCAPQQQQPSYPTFGMGEDAFQQSQQQRQQLPGGLVNAFTSPGGTSASSPADLKPIMSGNAGMSAPGMPNESGNGFGGYEAQNKDRFGPANYPTAPKISPSLNAGPDQDMNHPHAISNLKRQQQQQHQQQPFGSYFGNNAAN
ncbi:hypothetical protein NDA11_005624 [Ustilago hordei]|nr:hypothetical protein NDA10_005895 [Ustilago hordei]KAJ1571225.1 hypothetical protein NDA12_003073 [Ustilago hordei]KAJ1571438.1 hypothetical protein NDA15_002309 [Ustilago hordei]KAJ1596115.1 hypothetical protein NDA11_005624 [Ustilago hordei]